MSQKGKKKLPGKKNVPLPRDYRVLFASNYCFYFLYRRKEKKASENIQLRPVTYTRGRTEGERVSSSNKAQSFYFFGGSIFLKRGVRPFKGSMLPGKVPSFGTAVVAR